LDKLYFIGFLFGLVTTTLVTVVFLGWWMLNCGLRTWDKLLGLVIIVGEAWLVGRYSHRSINYFGLWMSGVPLVATAVVAWLFLVKKFQISSARLGFVVVVTLVWGHFLLIRDDGLDSRLKVARHWRWTPTSEEQFLSKSTASFPAKGPSPNTNDLLTAKASSGDWTCFRGINRDGVIRATVIATNWNLHPPVQIWKHAVGPAWSSLLVVGNRTFTQEQRGENEAVVCYDATTGSEVWAHTDMARFEESVSGPGPRATPTFSHGRLYALGGTGILNCLETITGKSLWKRDIKEASGAKVPMWAFSSSPLVTDGLVVVYAGGEAGKGVLAYRQETGELAWAAPAGTQLQFSSAHRDRRCPSMPNAARWWLDCAGDHIRKQALGNRSCDERCATMRATSFDREQQTVGRNIGVCRMLFDRGLEGHRQMDHYQEMGDTRPQA
jgi:hypothetical protein